MKVLKNGPISCKDSAEKGGGAESLLFVEDYAKDSKLFPFVERRFRTERFRARVLRH